jgi:hypothetical protein
LQGRDEARFDAQPYHYLHFRGRERRGRRRRRPHQLPPRLKSFLGGTLLAAQRTHQRMTLGRGQQFHVVEARLQARLPPGVSSPPLFGGEQRSCGAKKWQQHKWLHLGPGRLLRRSMCVCSRSSLSRERRAACSNMSMCACSTRHLTPVLSTRRPRDCVTDV